MARRSSPLPPAAQLSLFEEDGALPGSGLDSPIVNRTIHASTLLPEAIRAFEEVLASAGHSENTVASYSWDLVKLQKILGPKRLDRITSVDIGKYLGDASSKMTRKRRLTSARRFFHFLVQDLKAIPVDPTAGFVPHTIPDRMPATLSSEEQRAILDAAGTDEAWSAPAIWLMMRLGVSRSELLTLKRDHIDRSRPEHPVIEILYEDPMKRGKERRLTADAEFAALYADYLERRDPADTLFPIGRQAVNGMVDRVRRSAGIDHDVTPQMLRHTFGCESARAGADVPTLLELLGLADDPRNRAAVGKYITLATPPDDANDTPSD